MAEAQMKKAKEVMKAPEVKSLLKTAGIKTSQRPYLQGRILGWMKRGQGMPALKANLCKLLIKGLRNARPMLPTQKAKDKADIAIGKLRFKLTQISRQTAPSKRTVAQAPTRKPKPLLSRRDFDAMRRGKREMVIKGKLTILPEPRKMRIWGSTIMLTNKEKQVLKKHRKAFEETLRVHKSYYAAHGIRSPEQLVRQFNRDVKYAVPIMKRGENPMVSVGAGAYATAVNQEAKKRLGITGPVRKGPAMVAKGPDIKASKEKEAPPINSYTYTFTARSREKYGMAAGKPVTFTINSKKPLGSLSLLNQEALARAGVTVVKGNKDKFTAVVNDPHFYDTQLTLVSKNYAKRKRS
jgi:hypothetical protein